MAPLGNPGSDNINGSSQVPDRQIFDVIIVLLVFATYARSKSRLESTPFWKEEKHKLFICQWLSPNTCFAS